MFSRGKVIRDTVAAIYDVLTEIKAARTADSEAGAVITDKEAISIGAAAGALAGAIVTQAILDARDQRR